MSAMKKYTLDTIESLRSGLNEMGSVSNRKNLLTSKSQILDRSRVSQIISPYDENDLNMKENATPDKIQEYM